MKILHDKCVSSEICEDYYLTKAYLQYLFTLKVLVTVCVSQMSKWKDRSLLLQINKAYFHHAS